MNNLSPKAEPVAWSVAVGLVVAALASYGLNITVELKEALVVLFPMAIAGWVARQHVYAPDTVQTEIDQAALSGVAKKV